MSDLQHRKLEFREMDEPGEVIGKMPASLYNWGLAVLTVFLAVIFVGGMYLPYPDVLTGRLMINPSRNEAEVRGIIYLPAANIGSVIPGIPVRAETENYPSSHYGMLQGKVESVCGTPEQNDLYCVHVSFSQGLVTDKGYVLSDTMLLVGTGKIVLNDRRLSEVIMAPLFKWIR